MLCTLGHLAVALEVASLCRRLGELPRLLGEKLSENRHGENPFRANAHPLTNSRLVTSRYGRVLAFPDY